MISNAPALGYYFLLAGVMNERSSGVSGGGPSDYPSWVRPFIIVSVIVTWMGLNGVSAAIGRNIVPWYIHVAVLLLIASLFRVEFGNIHLVSKEQERDR